MKINVLGPAPDIHKLSPIGQRLTHLLENVDPSKSNMSVMVAYLFETFRALLKKTLPRKLDILPMTHSEGYWQLPIRNAYLGNVLHDYKIPAGQLDLNRSIPKPILNGDKALLSSFVSGTTDIIGGIDSAFSADGRKRVVLNLLNNNPKMLEDLVNAFQKCHIKIFDVNLPVKLSSVIRKLKKMGIKISSGTHTPHIRVWLDEYQKHFVIRNGALRG